MTTNSYINPSYGLLTIDAKTMVPLNYQMYTLDIDANKNNDVAVWELSVDYVRDYQLNFTSPDEMYELAERMN